MSDVSITLSSRCAFSYHWNKSIENDDSCFVRVVKSVAVFFKGLFGRYTVSVSVSVAEIKAIFIDGKHQGSILYNECKTKLECRKPEIANDLASEEQDIHDEEQKNNYGR